MNKTTKTAILVLSALLLWMLTGIFQNSSNSNDINSLKINTEETVIKVKAKKIKSELRQSNLFFLASIFVLFTIVWVLAAGFGSPVAIFAGFIFGKWIGTLVVVTGLSVGATFLYIFGNYFLRDLIREKFLNKFQNLEIKFKKSEFFYLLVYRFIGGVPWQISCLLPTLFNVRVKNFLFATFLGIIPQIFLAVSIGSGIEKVIDQNSEVPEIKDIIFSTDIYVPLLAFFVLIAISIIFRKKFYRN